MMQPPTPHRTHRPIDPSLKGTLAAFGLLGLFVALLANPAVTTAVVLGGALCLHGLRNGLRRVAGTTQEVSIPGVGTVEYRITPR